MRMLSLTAAAGLLATAAWGQVSDADIARAFDPNPPTALTLRDTGQAILGYLVDNRVQHSGFSLSVYTPVTFIADKHLRPVDVTEEMRRPVLRVVVHPDSPEVRAHAPSSSVSHVVIQTTAKKPVVLQPLTEEPFDENFESMRGNVVELSGLTAIFPLDGLASIRAADPKREFIIRIVGSDSSKNFQVKTKHFPNLPGIDPPPAKAVEPEATATGRDSALVARGLATLRAKQIQFDEWSFASSLSRQNTDEVQAFLDAGMDPGHPLSSTASSPLMRVIQGGGCPDWKPTPEATRQIMDMLLSAGADVNQVDRDGSTVLTFAAARCDRPTVRLLISAGAKFDGVLEWAIRAAANDGVLEVIAAGARLDPKTAKEYLELFKDTPATLELVKKASP